MTLPLNYLTLRTQPQIVELKQFANENVWWIYGKHNMNIIKLRNNNLFFFFYNKQKVYYSRNTFFFLNNFFFLLTKQFIERKSKSQTIRLLYFYLLSLNVWYKQIIRLRGIGYKFLIKYPWLAINVGLNHKFFLKIFRNYKIKTNRKFRIFRIYYNNFFKLKNIISYIQNLKCPDIYKGKGIRIKHLRYRRKKIKKGKKRR